MPWQARSPMDERVQFITDYQRQLFTMTTLCERYGISRKTGYKLVARYDAEGAAGGVLSRAAARREPASRPAAPVARPTVISANHNGEAR